MKPVTILYLTWNRANFTEWSFSSLLANTNPKLVERILVIDSGSSDGAYKHVLAASRKQSRFTIEPHQAKMPSVPHAMNFGLGRCRTPLISKIDNDAVVPPKWLDAAFGVLRDHARVGILGLEPMWEVGGPPYRVVPANYVGGLILMRRSVLRGPIKSTSGRYFGWQEYQVKLPCMKAWIRPGIPLFVLDRMPIEPFRSWSDVYVRKGWQRRPPHLYSPTSAIWKWRIPG